MVHSLPLHEELSLLAFVINNNYYIFSHFIKALTPTASTPHYLNLAPFLFFCKKRRSWSILISPKSTLSFWRRREEKLV